MPTIRDEDARDPSKWTSFAEPDPEFVEASKAAGGAPMLEKAGNIKALREFLAKSKAAMTDGYGPIPGVKEDDHQVTVWLLHGLHIFLSS